MSIFTDGERLLERHGESSFNAFLRSVLGSDPYTYDPDIIGVYPGSRSSAVRQQVFDEIRGLLESEEGKNLYLCMCLVGGCIDFGLFHINRQGLWEWERIGNCPTKKSLFSIVKYSDRPNEIASEFAAAFRSALKGMNRGKRKTIRS